MGHGVIVQRGKFIIIGGESLSTSGSSYARSTEKCVFKGYKIKCTEVDPELMQYSDYPLLMHVPYDYCPK